MGDFFVYVVAQFSIYLLYGSEYQIICFYNNKISIILDMITNLFIDYIVCSGVFSPFLDGDGYKKKKNQCVKMAGEFDQLFYF